MQRGKGSLLFLLYAVCAALFVWRTGLALPDLVASHFGAGGTPNGFMPRHVYIGVMIVVAIGLPTVMLFITRAAMASPGARINLPNRDYWLAPERRSETLAFLRDGVLWFGVLLLTFLCYVHWLVVRANISRPAHLAESWMFGGLAVFLITLLIWLKLFIGHFSRKV